MNKPGTRYLKLIVAFALLAGLCGEPVEAAFELNFLPVQNPGSRDFLKGGYSNTGNPFLCPDAANPDCLIGTEAVNDPTPFYYERVDGYWHIIVGDPNEGFAQETYTPIVGLFHSDTGGREPVFFTLSGNLEQWSGNGWDPLEFENKTFGPEGSQYAGNGTGNPTQVVVRQVLGVGTLANSGSFLEAWNCAGGEFCQEFLKAEMAFKPVITQTYDDGIVSMNFVLDMSAISYTDMTTPALMTNIIAVNDVGMPFNDPNINAPSPSYFDMAVDSQDSVVTGGRYIYTAGSGWHSDGDGDPYMSYGTGSYEYLEGVSTYPLETDWSSYFDASQNAAGVYPGNQARCADLAMVVCSNPPAPY